MLKTILMLQHDDDDLPRPSMMERLEMALEKSSVNRIIRILENVYQETQSEGVLEALNEAKTLKAAREEAEARYQKEDMDELKNTLGRWPYSTQMWILHYAEKEQEID